MLLKLFKVSESNYIKAVKCDKRIYIIHLYEFVPANKELAKWKNAFGKPKAQI